MEAAVAGGYAVGYFESWNLESLQGTIDAAEATRSPIIIGFNGDFLCRPERLDAVRLRWYGALARAAAESATVPCAVIFNECRRDDCVMEAITAGFNLVMPADPDAPVQEYSRRVARIVEAAHRQGVAVEAELGELPCGASGAVEGGALTDPEAATRFAAETGADLLAVSVGNVHVRTRGQGGLDLDRLAELRACTSVPRVLHGGTGIAEEALRSAIALGVRKVNYGTYLKQRYLAAVRRALGAEVSDPHQLLGIGGPQDVMTAGRLAVRDAVLERIGWLGCVGRAS